MSDERTITVRRRVNTGVDAVEALRSTLELAKKKHGTGFVVSAWLAAEDKLETARGDTLYLNYTVEVECLPEEESS